MINKQRLIKLTQKVLSINSENPPGNELALAKFIEKDMRSLGLHVKKYTYAQKRPNIVATLKGRLPRKQAQKEALLITPHFDTVPIGKGWKHDPYGSQIINGKLYGRGATDDKSDLACSMEALRSLIEEGYQPKKDIVFASTVDEETGSHYGIIPLLEKKILKPKFALVLDSDEFDTIIAQKGLFHARIQIEGKKSHGAYNWRGVNAIEIAAAVIQDLKKIKFRHKKHPLLHAPTINIGTIHGGDKVNMVADQCEFSVDLRFSVGMDPKAIKKKMTTVIQKHAKKFKLIIDDIQLPYEIRRDHPCVNAWVKTVRRSGVKAKIMGSEGATVITFFQKHAIPAFATGFGAHGTAHCTDEYVYVKTLHKGAEVLEKFIREYDGLEF